MNGHPPSEKSLFLQVIGVPAPERAAFLDQACGNDQQLRREVESLLQLHDQSGDLLDVPDSQAANVDLLSPTVQLGTYIGPYKLIEVIGEGGMGLVYMARQREPVERNVALKVIKPGMDSRQVVARFEAERQALALMDHPNIARILDGGTTESRLPYFVMDLVRGIPITEYCNQQCMTTRQRLELFTSVCKAVQHAHQKGIIHRDLKPSNVMITLHDGTPVPKVIDFGIAKALHQTLTEESLVTGFAQLVGTPLYMSPEQAEMSGLDIDTRSDVYSLGVLLYELLTGLAPFDREKVRDAPLDEVRRIIREDEPARPSTRISTLDAAGSSTISHQRGVDARQLSNLLRGELDWIVMKALEKDRTRRYESANELAKDVQRYLADKAVEACPPSTIYRLRKLVRRNLAAYLTITAVSLAIIFGATIAIWQGARATRALRDLENEQEQVLREKMLAEDNFRLARTAVDEHFTIASESELPEIRRKLLETSLKYYQRFVELRADDAMLRTDVTSAYERIGDILTELGHHGKAITAYRMALVAWEAVSTEAPGGIESQHNIAECHYRLGIANIEREERKLAQVCLKRAVEVWEKLLVVSPGSRAYQERLADTYLKLARLQRETADFRSAKVSIEKSQQLTYGIVAESSNKVQHLRALAQQLTELGRVQELTGEQASALRSYSEAITLQELLVRDHLSTEDNSLTRAKTHQALGALYSNVGELDPAVVNYRKSIEILEPLSRLDPAHSLALAVSCSEIARLYVAMDKPTETVKSAIKSFRSAISIREQLVIDNPESAIGHLYVVAESYQNMGDLSATCDDFESAVDYYKVAAERFETLVTLDTENAHFLIALSRVYDHLGEVQTRTGEVDLAAESYRKVWMLRTAIPEDQRTVFDLGFIARSLYRTGQWQQARKILEELIQQCGDTGPTLAGGYRWWYLTMTLAQLGDIETAASHYRVLEAELQAQAFPDSRHHWLKAETASLLNMLHDRPEEFPAQRK